MEAAFEPRFGQAEWRLAYGVALRILKAPDQAEDAAQETLMRAYRKRAMYSGASRFNSWLHRIAYTTALEFLRKPHYRRYQAPAAGSTWDQELERMASPAETPEQQATTHQLASRLQGCLCTMQEQDRLAFTERFLLGTSERELGEKLGITANAAKLRAFRARRVVRRYMEEVMPRDVDA
jgi:RNA polymerase sigma-70 factor (ECF subfamily)